LSIELEAAVREESLFVGLTIAVTAPSRAVVRVSTYDLVAISVELVGTARLVID
jgi:hypothetical protein